MIRLSNEYNHLHSQMMELETELINLSNKREILSSKLNDCRSLEKVLINKIEKDTKQTVTADLLNNILLNEKS
jgi:predicted RNase H-like nuclease (RuvC/YqgF family)